MVMTKPELIASLQNEVRIVLHLAGMVHPAVLDDRPTAVHWSMRALVLWLAMMGPTVVRYALAETPDIGIWTSAEQASEAWDFDASVAAIAGQADDYASLLAGASEATLRSQMTDFEGKPTSRGVFIVNMALCGSAAYRMQLFLYLKAAGQEHLNSANLWSGVDMSMA